MDVMTYFHHHHYRITECITVLVTSCSSSRSARTAITSLTEHMLSPGQVAETHLPLLTAEPHHTMKPTQKPDKKAQESSQ